LGGFKGEQLIMAFVLGVFADYTASKSFVVEVKKNPYQRELTDWTLDNGNP